MLHLSDVRIYSDGSVSVENKPTEPPAPPVKNVITNRVAIVNRLPDQFIDPLPIEVNYCKLHDTLHPTKGDSITVYPSTLRHMAKIQSAGAYGWTVRPFMLWTNRRYDGDPLGSKLGEVYNGTDVDKYLRAECITGYGNFVEILDEIGEFYEIRATPTDIDWDQFDESFNWFNYPCLWVKESARNKKIPPDIFNVGNGYDAYFPLLKASPKLYILKSSVEVLPPSPDGGYILQGMSVYTAGMQPLRLARKPGELIYPRDDWKMQTAGVIPAK